MVTKMECFGCGRRITIILSYTKRGYCDGCFEKMIEKRVRKDLRTTRKLSKTKHIRLYNDDSKEFEVAKKLLKNIFGAVKTIEGVGKKGKDVLIPTNLDREVRKQLESYLENKTNPEKEKKILQNIMEEELVQLCKIWKINIKKTEKKNMLMEDIEKKYPGTKFCLAKSFEKMNS